MRVLHFSVNEQNIKKIWRFLWYCKRFQRIPESRIFFRSEWSRRKAAASFLQREKNMQSRSSGTGA